MWMLHLRLLLTPHKHQWRFKVVLMPHESLWMSTFTGQQHRGPCTCYLSHASLGGGMCVWAVKVVSSITGKPINSMKKNKIKVIMWLISPIFFKINNLYLIIALSRRHADFVIRGHMEGSGNCFCILDCHESLWREHRLQNTNKANTQPAIYQIFAHGAEVWQ